MDASEQVALAPRAAPMSITGAGHIAQELKDAILGGVYATGQRLPPERHLATHYGASRSTVREALRRLEEQHLVERRIGSGTFVTYRDGIADEEIAELTSPIELIEVRSAIEPQIARLAVLHATARDLERLGTALKALKASEADASAYAEADDQFHLALANATGNLLMIWLYRRISEVRQHAQWGAMRAKILNPENMRLYNEQHEAVFEAIRRRDADAAVAAMLAQMAKARADLEGAQDGGRR
jgi:DNA-binding FadR family transcriptional regulator